MCKHGNKIKLLISLTMLNNLLHPSAKSASIWSFDSLCNMVTRQLMVDNYRSLLRNANNGFKHH